MSISEKLLLIAARRSTETSFGWAHPDCETLQEAARLLRGESPVKADDDYANAILSAITHKADADKEGR